MRKGDLKKQEIVRTAEALFCRNGYEATGVQEIIDALHTSKGSFYHHFASKEALLEEICRSRIEVSAQKYPADPEAGPLAALNALLTDMIPFSGEKISFLLMLLPVFSMPEGIHLRSFYGKELAVRYLPQVAAALEEGTAAGVFSCRDAAFYAETALLLVNRLWMKICDMILENEAAGSVTDPAALMAVTGRYRLAVERLLCAPFGSVDLIRLPGLLSVTEQIHLHWKKP